MNKSKQGTPENSCKNCSHPISLHMPNCLFKSEENNDDICGCKDAQYHNVIISGKYIGWMEIHCNSCGKMLGLIDNIVEHAFDFTTLCSRCIRQVLK
jgi:hypothetical protein